MPVVFVYDTLMGHPTIREHGLPARVDDHVVRYQAKGMPLLAPRYLGLIPEPGGAAYGVVVEINDAAWARMKKHGAYMVFEEVVAVVDDHEVDARALVLRRQDRAPEGRTSARYAAEVLEAARHHGLPDEIVAYYQQALDTAVRLPWERA